MMTRLNNCLNYIKLLRIPLKGMEVHQASTETVCGNMCLLTELKKTPNFACVKYVLCHVSKHELAVIENSRHIHSV